MPQVKRIRPKCKAQGCPHRVRQLHNKFCSKRCAWLTRKGWEIAAKGRVQANIVRKRNYTARLRERLKGLTTVGQIWQAAYRAGFRAGYACWLSKVQRGEVQYTRRDREVA